jgi:hypothetical protein
LVIFSEFRRFAMPLYSGWRGTRILSLLDCLTPKITLMPVTPPIDRAWNLREVQSTATRLRELQISYCASFIQTKPSVLQTEIIATNCDNHIKHFVNTPCGQNTDLVEVKAGVLSCEYLDFFFVAQQSLMGHTLLIIESSRWHSNTPHSLWLLWTSYQYDTENHTWQHTPFTRDIHASSRIRTRSPSKRTASDPREYLGGVVKRFVNI